MAFKHYLLLFGVPASLVGLQSYLPKNFYFDGSPEVSLFIVHSGFVLTLGYFSGKRGKKKISVRETYIARIARIFPAFLAVFFLGLMGKAWAYAHFVSAEQSQIVSRFWPALLDASSILRQMTLLPFVQRGAPIVPPDWTLVLEIKYSLLLPFLLLIVRHRRSWLALVAGMFVWTFGRDDNLFFGFTLGMLLASFYQPLKAKLGDLNRMSKASLLAAAIGLYYLSGVELPLYFPLIVDSVAGLLILCLAMSSRTIRAFLELAPLRNLGRVSYSLYLSHFVILLCLAPYWRDWTSGFPAKAFWDVALYCVCCLGLSNLLFRFVEQPGIRLGKALRSRLEPQGTPHVAELHVGNFPRSESEKWFKSAG